MIWMMRMRSKKEKEKKEFESVGGVKYLTNGSQNQ